VDHLMMKRFLTKIDLHHRLVQHGHSTWPEAPPGAFTEICPPPEHIVTVALNTDWTLRPPWRQRYFVCVKDVNSRPILEQEPAFALPDSFAAAAAREPAAGHFMGGPLRWLLLRLRAFSHICLWPEGGYRGPDGMGFLLTTVDGKRLDQAPHLLRWLGEAAPEPSSLGAAVLDSRVTRDCQVLWEAANLVTRGNYNFYLSDLAGSQVYTLHHHDKVEMSIPDSQRRQLLLQELTGWGKVLQDCSGYSVLSNVEPEDPVETIPLSGFDPNAEPEIQVMRDGSLYVLFDLMPPPFAAGDEKSPLASFKDFDREMEHAIGVPVIWVDRECFLIEAPEHDTVEKTKHFIETYWEKKRCVSHY
jgi:hypothetical protein